MKMKTGIYEEIMNDLDKKMEHDERLMREAEQGKRHFWIIRNRYNQLFLYPEGYSVIEHITNYDIQDYKRKGYIKVVPKNKTKLILNIKKEIEEARARYNALLKEIFYEGEKDE